MDRVMDCYQREIAAMFTMHNHILSSCKLTTILYPFIVVSNKHNHPGSHKPIS